MQHLRSKDLFRDSIIFCFFSIPASIGVGKADEHDEQLSSKVVIISDVGKDMHLCLECLSVSFWWKPYICWEIFASLGCTLCTVVKSHLKDTAEFPIT